MFTKRSFHHDSGESMKPMKASVPPESLRLRLKGKEQD